jgi:hypothetical protein
MARSTEKSKSQSERRRDGAEVRDALPGYALVLGAFVVMLVVDRGRLTAGNIVWALLSFLGVLWFVGVEVRSLARADEYRRMIKLEALAIGFGSVMVLLFAAGLLDALGLDNPRRSYHAATTAGLVAWLAALGLKTRRAR